MNKIEDTPKVEKYTMKEIPEAERPQEKLLRDGPQYMSSAELLALIIRTGTAKETALELGHRILYGQRNKGLSFLANATAEELMEIEGVKEAKASMILAAVELGRRMRQHSFKQRLVVNRTSALPDYLMDEMQFLQVEEFRIASLDTKKGLIALDTITKGILDGTMIHPREVFEKALARRAHTVILVHNHPSGNPEPSKEDVVTTQRLIEAGKIMGVPVIDHIIIGNHTYYSFLEKGLI